MTLKNITTHFLSLFFLLTVFSCSGSTASKKDVPNVYNIAGYYDGNLSVESKHKKDESLNVIESDIDQTILLKKTELSANEYTLTIVNFQWENHDVVNIEFLVEVQLDEKNKTAKIEAFKQFSNHEVIPNSEMNLEGSINNGEIKLSAKFLTSAELSFNYDVTFNGVKSSNVYKSYQFSFETWTEVKNPMLKGAYQIPSIESGFVWDTSDFEVQSYIDRGRAEKLTVGPHDKNILGKKSAHIRTIGLINSDQTATIPAIYAGILFTGYYDYSLAHPHERIRLGAPFSVEPLSLKGYYVYKPGKEYMSCLDINKPSEVVLEPDKKDSFSIEMYLYEVLDYSESLSLRDIRTSSKVVGQATYTSDLENESFESFEAKFEFKDGYTYDSAKIYKLALLITPSKNGVAYSGAVDSRILIDNFEITTRK